MFLLADLNCMVISYDISRADLAIVVFWIAPNCLQCFDNFHEVHIYFSKNKVILTFTATEQQARKQNEQEKKGLSNKAETTLVKIPFVLLALSLCM